MANNAVISRTDSQALVPEVVSRDILAGLVNKSAALTLFRRIPMSTNQTRMPVLSQLPIAFFVSGDTGQKQSADAAWSNKYLNVEELAAIIPIPEAVLDDTNYDVWGAMRPLMEDAVARALDAAVFFGINIPASWPTAIVPGAVAASQTVTRGTATAAQGGLAGDISASFAQVESDGYDVSGIVANRSYRGLLRQVRSTQGEHLDEVNTTSAYGVDITYPMRGLWPTGSGSAEFIDGDFSQGILGVRQDFTYKILDQAVIQDASGNIIYNLPQQDMVALRLVFRVAFQIANVLNYDNPTDATRYPWSVVVAP
jgi:HK97 family phage major capsid protein